MKRITATENDSRHLGEAVLRAEMAQLKIRIRQLEAQQPLYRNFFGNRPSLGLSTQMLLPMGTWVWELATNQTQWSQELFRILGYDPEQDKASVENYLAALHPDDRVKLEAAVGIALQEGEATRSTVRVLWPDGQCRHVQSEGVILRNEEGKAIRMLGFMIDVTDFKEQHDQSQRTQQLLHEAQLLAQVGSWIWSLDEGWMEWSEGAWRIAGDVMRPRISLLESLQLIHPEDAERVRKSAEYVMATPNAGVIETEYRIARKDGSVRHIFQRSRELETEPGMPRMRLGTVLDVTEARRAEDAVKRHVQLLNEAQNLGQAGYWLWYLDTNKVEWSDSLAGIAGLEKGVAADLFAVMQRVHPDDYERVKASVMAAVEGNGEQSIEFRICLPSGEVRHLVQRSRPLESALLQQGRARFGTIVDITHLRRAEARSAQANYVADTALRLAKAGSWIFNPSSGAITWSDELYRLTGVPLGQAITRELFHSLVHADDLEEVRCLEQQSLGAQKHVTDTWHHFRLIRADTGELRHFEMQGYWVDWGGGEGRVFVGINIDVTERRKQEEAMRQAHKLEAIGRLAGGVAHDFNNLLTVMLGHAEELYARHPNERLSQILKAGSLGAALTQRLLAFSRQAVVRPQSIDISSVAASMGTLLERLLGEDIGITYKLKAQQVKVSADVGQVEQVILNLAINARDAMPAGGRLSIETEVVSGAPAQALPRLVNDNYPHRGAQVMLAVEDTGIGMGPEVMKHLFEPFFTTKEVGKGTGLGLSTVFSIITEAQGRIAVKSEPGKGTRFEVYWPIETATQAAGLKDMDGQTATEDPGSRDVDRPGYASRGGDPQAPKPKVAVVEDNIELRKLLIEMLESGGYETLSFAAASEVVELRAETVKGLALLVTDMVMPGLHGQAVARELRKHHAALPVLFISGYPRMDVDGDLDGAFLQKPFSRSQFLALVDEQVHAA